MSNSNENAGAGAQSPVALLSALGSALVVDDDEFVRKVLQTQLTGLGITRVVTAGDGGQAREILRANGPFDFMICDLRMPRVDGLELMRDIADIQSDLGVILVSSVDQRLLSAARALADSRNVNVLGILQKPVTLVAIRTLLDEWMKSRAAAVEESGAKRKIRAEDLAAAMSHDEIDIFVQPQIDVNTRQLVGVEALARWFSPDLGEVGPSDFIPLAEESGLIDAMTELIFRKSMKTSVEWRNQGLSTRIAVNITAQNLKRLDLMERLTEMRRTAGAEDCLVQLEITESGQIGDLPTALDVLSRFRLHSFELALDDFGTGYSTLTNLKNIPFNELKMDSSFVSVAEHDADARRIIRSSVKLAHGLGLKVVAEGVETEAVWDIVKVLGCDIVQGYLIARPMPTHEMVVWAAAYTGD